MLSLSLISFLLLQIFSINCLSFDDMEDSFFEIKIDRDDPNKLFKEFEDFIVKYKRVYKDEIEKKFRYEQYVRTHNQVQKLNEKVEKLGHDTKYGINKFSDRTKDEINSLFSKYGPSNTSNVPMLDLNNLRTKREVEHLPKSFNLRNKKVGGRYVIGPVKNQGNCSCCWAFAATALAEVALSVHMKKLITLSDQEVCDCAAPHGPGCSGALPTDGLEYIKNTGLATDTEYPYNENRSLVAGRCDAHNHDRELNPYTLVYGGIDPFNAEHLITRALYNRNVPVAVAFRTSQTFAYYKEGILELQDCLESEENHWHSGIIVGYGKTINSKGREVEYWDFKNSWDNDWGDSGYARIVRSQDWCNIESYGVGAYIPEE
ncbi:unnamed protein product [Caenorhabditis brenneri]